MEQAACSGPLMTTDAETARGILNAALLVILIKCEQKPKS